MMNLQLLTEHNFVVVGNDHLGHGLSKGLYGVS